MVMDFDRWKGRAMVDTYHLQKKFEGEYPNSDGSSVGER